MEECEIVKALNETLTFESVTNSDEVLCSTCTSSCIAGIVTRGSMELIIWDSSQESNQSRSIFPVISRLSSDSNSVACAVNINYEDFQVITVRKVTVDVDHSSVQVIGCAANTLYRWEFLSESYCGQYEINYDISADLSNSQKKVCLDIFGERSATIDNKTITVRSEQLNRVRMFSLPISKENNSINDITDVTFGGTNHDIVVVCYEKGLIVVS